MLPTSTPAAQLSDEDRCELTGRVFFFLFDSVVNRASDVVLCSPMRHSLSPAALNALILFAACSRSGNTSLPSAGRFVGMSCKKKKKIVLVLVFDLHIYSSYLHPIKRVLRKVSFLYKNDDK